MLCTRKNAGLAWTCDAYGQAQLNMNALIAKSSQNLLKRDEVVKEYLGSEMKKGLRSLKI